MIRQDRPASPLDPDYFEKGGAGSGNFGHAGRPGERGGSSTDGGGNIDGSIKDNRPSKEYIQRIGNMIDEVRGIGTGRSFQGLYEDYEHNAVTRANMVETMKNKLINTYDKIDILREKMSAKKSGLFDEIDNANVKSNLKSAINIVHSIDHHNATVDDVTHLRSAAEFLASAIDHF